MVKADKQDVFYEELLGKKMKKNTWRQYWVVLREDRLVFISESERKIAGIIKLTEETTCRVLEKKVSRQSRSKQPLTSTLENINSEGEQWKFKLFGKRGVHLLKTDCKSSCEKWTEAISRAVQSLMNNAANITTITTSITGDASGRNNFKYLLQRNFKNVRTKMFGYAALLEEDVETDNPEDDVMSTGFPNTKLRRSTLSMRRINFLNTHLLSRGNDVNYALLR